MSSRHTAEACWIVIHLIENPPFFSWCQPYAFGSGRFCCAIRDCLQQLSWYIARFVCWRRTSCVGGMASSDLPFVANNAFRQSLTDSRRLDWSYKRVTYLSIVGNSSFSSWSEGKLEHETKLAVTSSKFFQVLHALFSPFSVKSETWSHLVNAWKNCRPLHLTAPIASKMEWIDSRRWFLPVPNDIHSSDKFTEENIPRAMTTTSASTVRIMTFPIPLWLAFAACSSIRLSASSWFDRQRVDTLSNYLFIVTAEPIVLMINFSVSSFVTSFARKPKSSSLFSYRHKSDCQFPGIFLVGRTLRRIPLPTKWRGSI